MLVSQFLGARDIRPLGGRKNMSRSFPGWKFVRFGVGCARVSMEVSKRIVSRL